MRKIQNWFFGKSAYKEFSISSIFRVFYFFVESACPISLPHPGFHPSSWQSSFTFISCVICSSLSATASHCTLLVSFLGFQHLPKISSIYLCTHTLKPRIHIWKDMRDFFFFLSLGSPHILYFPNLPIYPKVLFFQHKEVFHVSKGISSPTLLYFCKAGKSKFILE